MPYANIHERHLRLANQAVKALTKPSSPSNLKEIWLHGSVARKEDGEFSDVDLLLLLARGEDSWLPCINAIFDLLEGAHVSIRPRSRRLEKFPNTVQVDFFLKDEFNQPGLLLARASSGPGLRAAQNTVNFLNTAKAEGRRLYPRKIWPFDRVR